MSIIRIKVRDNISDNVAIRLVKSVIDEGLISHNNTQYCWITRFEDENGNGKKITVYCDKGKSGSHLFEVYHD